MSKLVSDAVGDYKPSSSRVVVAVVQQVGDKYVAIVDDLPTIAAVGATVEECRLRIRHEIELALNDSGTVHKSWRIRIDLTKWKWKKLLSYAFSILLAILNLLDTIGCLKLLDYRGAAIYSLLFWICVIWIGYDIHELTKEN